MQQIKKKCSKMFALLMAFILMFSTIGQIQLKASGGTGNDASVEPIFKYDMDGDTFATNHKADGGISFDVSTDTSNNNKYLTLTC